MRSLANIITEIQSLGVRVPNHLEGRNGGAGPAEGKAFLIRGFPVNAPINAPYVSRSPYAIRDVERGFVLLKNGEEPVPLELPPEPRFYDARTSDGSMGRQIALLHGKDCLATTVIQRCVHWKTRRGCAFCGTELSLQNGRTVARKTPEQLSEVARMARQWDGVTHMVLTSGVSDSPGSELSYLALCVRSIKKTCDLPVHVQVMPPDDPDRLLELKDAGVDTIGIHIESFDPDVLERRAPVKAALGLLRYEKAWVRAVRLFGPNQVSSFVIAGLGESPQSVLWGSELLADLGVYPYVAPLRPIPGSRMADALPPSPAIMIALYRGVADILKRKGLSSRRCLAGCVRCGACSALHAFEEPVERLVCHSARTDEEKAAAFGVRHQVFVNEQRLFSETDVDEHDDRGRHLVANLDEDIVGTVRIYPGASGNGHWIGGRLAVLKDHRSSKVGELLVEEAVRRVKQLGCTLFTAHIQQQNVPLFLKLGWKPVGPIADLLGRPHQMMQAPLEETGEKDTG
ncbi:MAG: MSMEG_0568 family radical SAM protein [Deltaproteobacteria bacterium]|nr:MSMEG_0568 family radical SAM protein [Deltaproteobacteria bacterium]